MSLKKNSLRVTGTKICVLLTVFLGFGCGAKPTSTDQKHSAGHHSGRDLQKHLDAPNRDAWQKPKEVLLAIGSLENKKVMDIGAGTGYFSYKLLDAGAEVIAADTDDYFIELLTTRSRERARNSKALEIRKVPVDSPELTEGEVDVVLLVDTYHHIHNRQAYFKKVARGLKEGGQLVIVDYKKDSFLNEGPPREMRLTPENVVDELTTVGFVDFDIRTELLPKQYLIKAFKKTSKRVSGTAFMKEYWNENYAKEAYMFGTEPDGYFAAQLNKFQPGRLLLPAEGEGRNAVYAASLGWNVTAYDYSVEAKQKALRLAKKHGVTIDYEVQDAIHATYPKESFDMVGFLFVHFEGDERVMIHEKLDSHLKKGGILVLENFSTEHPKYNKQGPQKESLLYAKETILKDFPNYEILDLTVTHEVLHEGSKEPFECSVLRFVGRKK
jgi:SAM-dependent methyltransferase